MASWPGLPRPPARPGLHPSQHKDYPWHVDETRVIRDEEHWSVIFGSMLKTKSDAKQQSPHKAEKIVDIIIIVKHYVECTNISASSIVQPPGTVTPCSYKFLLATKDGSTFFFDFNPAPTS